MRAVVVTTGWAGEGACTLSRYPSPMLWLIDRPIVQHLCEGLFRHNVTTVDWIHDHPANDVRQFLGQGERWGMTFRHHMAQNETGCDDLSRAVIAAGGDGGPILFGHADRFVPTKRRATASRASVVLYGTPSIGTAEWTWGGWAELSADACRQFPARARDEAALVELLAGHALGECRWEHARQAHGARTLAEYLEANRAALAGATPELLVSRSASVHATAKLIGPVHVGRGVTIGAGAVVGPNVTVGTNCYIDRGVVLEDSVILPDTFVSGGARLTRVLADRGRVYRLGLQGETVAAEDGPVACLSRPPLARLLPGSLERARDFYRTLRARVGRRPTPPADA